jgi:hypothetical protein
VNQLELYDRAGLLIRSVAVRQDEQDATKWHLAEGVALGANQIESAMLRFGDGTSHSVDPSLFPTSVRINTLFIAVPTVPYLDDPDEPVHSL